MLLVDGDELILNSYRVQRRLLVEWCVVDTNAHQFARSLDWNLLKLLNEIVKAGGVTAASRTVSRKQPAISLALKRLEKNLHVTLCRRGRRGFLLTDEGAVVAQVCDTINALIDQLPNRVVNIAEEVRGHVRLFMISNIVYPPLDRAIQRFHEQYSNVQIVIQIAQWETVGNLLLNDEADIAIAPARFQRADLSYEFLFKERHRLYCGRPHPLFGKRINVRELANYPFISTGPDEFDDLTKYRLQLGIIGQQVAGVSQYLEEAKRLTILGVGICFLPELYAAPDVASGRLRPLLDRRHTASNDIYIITNANAQRHLARQLLLTEIQREIHKRDGSRDRP